jgi:hypothetical protein
MKSQLLIVVLLGLSLVTSGAVAGATNISGTWECAIERASGPVHDTLVFKQVGEKLSGVYSGSRGEHKFNGTVKGNKAVFTWESPPADGGKLPPTVTFDGTLESPTKMTGTVEVPFCKEGQKCKWTATKKK